MSVFLDQKMTRKDFLKKSGLAFAAALLAAKGIPATQANAATFSDNLEAGVTIGPNAPASVKSLWVDTTLDGHGILKYYDGSAWVPTSAVWS